MKARDLTAKRSACCPNTAVFDASDRMMSSER